VKTFNACYPERYDLETIVEIFSRAHFPDAKKLMVPHFAVMGIAMLLKPLDFLNIGIHPERVLKLVRSTDIFPGWLVAEGCEYPHNLAGGLKRWSEETSGKFD
jgi:hypothetical protein